MKFDNLSYLKGELWSLPFLLLSVGPASSEFIKVKSLGTVFNFSS